MNDADIERINSHLQEIREDIDNYELGLHVTLCFIHLYIWDDTINGLDNDIKFYIGYKFKKNDNTEVTPDIGIDLNNDSSIIGELKRSFPKNMDYCINELKKIMKYDDELFGWDDDYQKSIKEQNFILITNQKHSRRIRNAINENGIVYTNFSKRFCLIEYGKATGQKEAIFFRLESGNAPSFKEITNERLNEGISINLSYLIESQLTNIKFLDEKPPFVYLMGILWDHIFPSLISDEKWQESKNYTIQRHLIIDTSIEQIQELLIENYCHETCHNLVKKDWVREAIEKFVILDLAEDLGTEKYRIKYRKSFKIEDKRELYARKLMEIKLKKDFGEAQQKITDFLNS